MTRTQWIWLGLCWLGIALTVAQSLLGPSAELRRLKAENALLLERARSAEECAERLAEALNQLYYGRTGELPAAEGPLKSDRILEARR